MSRLLPHHLLPPLKNRILRKVPFVALTEDKDGVEAEIEATTRTPAPQTANSSSGRLARYVSAWRQITQNNFILRIVREGYKFQFASPPPAYKIVSNPSSEVKVEALSSEISRHLLSGAIKEVEFSEDQTVSRVFTVPKSSGGNRQVIDLKLVNKSIQDTHFKMEDRNFIKGLINQGDFMASIDLSDAFFSIPIHTESQKYTAFEFKNARYVYQVLPFGYKASPRIFTKMLKTLIGYLRARGVKISAYLDDIFLAAPTKEILKNNIKLTIDWLNKLGFTVNYKKSCLSPSRSILHLGYLWNSVDMSLSLPGDKIASTAARAYKLINKEKVSNKSLASFIGTVTSHSSAFQNAPLYYRALQRDLINSVNSDRDWKKDTILSQDAIKDLKFWSKCTFPMPPIHFYARQIDFVLNTDASLSGWGAVLSSGETQQGSWSYSESKKHINWLELKAVFNAFVHFKDTLLNCKVELRTDNTTTIFYINKRGGLNLRICVT